MFSIKIILTPWKLAFVVFAVDEEGLLYTKVIRGICLANVYGSLKKDSIVIYATCLRLLMFLLVPVNR